MYLCNDKDETLIKFFHCLYNQEVREKVNGRIGKAVSSEHH